MAATAYQQLIAELSRDIVADTAPQELPLFRSLSQAYFRDPEKTLKGQPSKDEMLGFGVGTAVAIVTPVIMAVMTDVAEFLIAELQQTLKTESSGLISDLLKRLFKKYRNTEPAGATEPPPLTAQQLAHVRDIAFERARLLNVPDAQAQLLAESVVGRLAIS